MNNGKNRQELAAAAALAFGVLVLAAPEAAARGFAGGAFGARNVNKKAASP